MVTDGEISISARSEEKDARGSGREREREKGRGAGGSTKENEQLDGIAVDPYLVDVVWELELRFGHDGEY